MKVVSLPKEQAMDAAGLLAPEVTRTLSKGLPVTVLLALDGHRAVGALGGAINDKVFDIVSLFVEPGSRRMGAGRSLINTLTGLLKDSDTMIRAQFNIENEENRTLESFFMALGFEREEVDYPAYYAVSVEELLGSAEGVDKDGDIKSFAETPGTVLRRTSNKSIDAGLPVPEGGLLGAGVDPEVSSCSIKEDTVEAYVAAEHGKDQMVKIPAMWSSLSNPRKMLAMLFNTTNALKDKYPPETKVAALAVNPASQKVIQYMFNDKETISRSFILPVV